MEHTKIDEYIATFPADVQEKLNALRLCLRKAAPKASETFKYAMPTLDYHGNLVHFAAYKHHIGFYPSPSGIVAFAKEFSKYKNSKGAVQFPIDQELPLELIAKVVAFRLKENEEKVLAKKKPSKSASSSKTANVDDYIAELKHALKPLVQLIREEAKLFAPLLQEHIKWNSLAYSYTGEIWQEEAYSRDVLVLNLNKADRILLVFPSGNRITNDSGFLKGDYKDGRKIAELYSEEDWQKQKGTFCACLTSWIQSHKQLR